MTRILGFGLAVLATLLCVPVVHAGSVPITGQMAGPVLSGDTAVWSQMSWPENRARFFAADPDGPARLLWEAPDNGCWSFPTDVAASATAIAALVHTSWENGCDPALQGTRVYVTMPGGGWRELPSRPEGSDPYQCFPGDLDVDGNRLAIAYRHCHQADAVVRDLATGEEQQIRFDSPVAVSENVEVALAGRYLAAHQWSREDPVGSLVPVYDLQAQRETFRADLAALYGGNGSRVSLDLAPDGTLVVAGADGGPFSDLTVASPDTPAHRVGHEVFLNWWSGPRITLVDGQVSASTRNGPALFRLSDGRVLHVGNPGWAGPVTWNGTRVAWADNGSTLRNERLEDAIRRGAPAPAPAAPSPPGTAPAAAPTAGSHCRVPRLRGLTLATARRRLAARRCRLGAVRRTRAASASRRPVVVSQAPRAGRRAKEGARVRVRLRVARIRR